MIEAFSKAREYCEVGLWVNASNLIECQQRRAKTDRGTDVPGEGDLDVLLINREAQVEQFQLAIVSVEKVPSGSAVLACTSHVLPEAVQGGALLGIPFWIVAIGVPDVVLERVYPVDLVGGLEWHGDHGNLRHDGAAVC